MPLCCWVGTVPARSTRVVTVNSEGQELASLELDAEVSSLSAAGRYVAVLCSDHLTIYDKQLLPVAELEEVSQAREVLMRSDGSAVLAGAPRQACICRKV